MPVENHCKKFDKRDYGSMNMQIKRHGRRKRKHAFVVENKLDSNFADKRFLESKPILSWKKMTLVSFFWCFRPTSFRSSLYKVVITNPDGENRRKIILMVKKRLWEKVEFEEVIWTWETQVAVLSSKSGLKKFEVRLDGVTDEPVSQKVAFSRTLNKWDLR